MQIHLNKGTDSNFQRITVNGAARNKGSSSGTYLKDNRPQSVMQQKMMANNQVVQKKGNNTGLPNNLKSGIENLSGYSMDDVRVHYNSNKPAQLNAYAYAQGSSIHIAPGQERHLPHEAWHVVQQKQGRVRPTMQMKGKVNVNDDKTLEKEADIMGAKALQTKAVLPLPMKTGSNNMLGKPIQLATEVKYTSESVNYSDYASGKMKTAIVGKKMTATLDPADPINGSEPGTGGNTDLLYEELNKAGPAGWGPNSFIRGHLLNANLGGLGVAENLFPITPAANHAHWEQIETPVKALLLNDNIVDYTVEVKRTGAGDFRLKPNSKIDCDVEVGGTHLIGWSLPSTVNEGNKSLNEELSDQKQFGVHGAGYAPGFNDWLTAGIGAKYVSKDAAAKLIATTDRQTIV